MRNQAEANLAALIESTDDFIWSVDRDFGLLTFNRALQRECEIVFGTTAAVGMKPEDLLPPSIAAHWSPLYNRALGEGPFRAEYKFENGHTLDLAFNPIVIDGETTGVSVFGKDITEHKRAEESLRESADFLAEAQRMGGLGIYDLDIAAGVWTSSDVMDEIFGIGREYERTVAGWTALLHADDRIAIPAYLAEEVVGKGRVFDREYRIVRRADGVERWVHGIGKLTFDAEGRPIRMRGTIKDITERRRHETELRHNEERYRATFEQAAVGIVHTSLDGRILRSNARFAEIAGYPPDEIPGMTFQQITVPEDVAESLGVLQRLSSIETGTAAWEKRYIRKDGSLTWVKLTISAQRDGEGRVLHYIAVVEDINDRKAAERRLAVSTAALEASESLYRTVFQTSPDAVMISRLSDGRILDANEAFFASAGYEREEVIGRTTLEIGIWVNQCDRDKFADELHRNGQCRDWEVLSKRKSGEIFWMRVSASVIEIEGCECLLSVARDISEAKAASERLAAAGEALRASEERYRATFQMSIDAININRLSDGVFVDVNQAFLSFMGCEREEVIGRTSRELNFWVDRQARERMIETLRRDSICRDLETRFRKKNGEIAWGQVSVSLIESDGVPCILSVTRDISAAKAAEERLAAATEALRVSETRYRTVFQTSLDSVTITRMDTGEFIDANEAFLDTTGYDRDEVIGHTTVELNLWTDPRDRQSFGELLHRFRRCQNLETCLRVKNGQTIAALLSAELILLDGVSCIVSFMRDISGVKEAAEKIKDLAFYDPLTHLPNRRLLMERLHEAVTTGAHIGRNRALLFVDLDHFKTLNDTLGHETGDLLLQEVARRLVSLTDDAATVARLGGDEFVMLLDGLSDAAEEAAAQAEAMAAKILAAVDRPYWLDGHECFSTSSIGITVFGDKREDINDVMQQADIAMYQAKAAGRNAMRFFAPALQVAVNARALLEEDLRQAIKSNQFELYYQPQVDCDGLIGAEALIRWNHPRRGLLAPGDFILLAEETGLILPLGDWVLETACAQIAAWKQRIQFAHITVAVNISARQFRQPGFVDQVLAVVERTGADPHNLKLELTESMLVDNIEDVIAKMSRFKSNGIGFSLDDFGTGYSSLSYLKRLPLDQLKIDRSFVQDILDDAGSRAIAQSVISLGKALRLKVIAEGVETAEQRDFLTLLGCHSFQGYLFSRPLALKDFEARWLDSPAYAAPTLQ